MLTIRASPLQAGMFAKPAAKQLTISRRNIHVTASAAPGFAVVGSTSAYDRLRGVEVRARNRGF